MKFYICFHISRLKADISFIHALLKLIILLIFPGLNNQVFKNNTLRSKQKEYFCKGLAVYKL